MTASSTGRCRWPAPPTSNSTSSGASNNDSPAMARLFAADFTLSPVSRIMIIDGGDDGSFPTRLTGDTTAESMSREE
jgi:hypothetical protein